MQVTGVSIHFVKALLDGTGRPDLDILSLLRQSGIDPAWFDDPEARVSASCYAALMRATALAMDDEFFGRDSRRMKVGSFAMLCYAVIGCRTLQRALQRALQFYALMLDDIACEAEEQDGRFRLRLCPDPLRPPDLFAHEHLLLFLHRLACWLVNRRIPLIEVGFAFPRPLHAAEDRLIFEAEPLFDQPLSHFSIDARYAALPVIRDEAALKEFLLLAPETLFVRYRPSHGTVHRVRRHLAALPYDTWPGFAELAHSLGMSASTLHRRLAAEDASFQAIKDQIRRDRAISLLRREELSIMAIAEALGFAEASAFHRAFRKWCGSAPGQFRREQMG
jgi:AraC-like DNA-binding protein